MVAGGETLLQRADGVVVVEANYYIRFADGAVARCFGRGYRTISGEFTGIAPVAALRRPATAAWRCSPRASTSPSSRKRALS